MSEVGVQYAMRALPARLQGDANVANHLFRLPRELLHRPGLITATWHRNGVYLDFFRSAATGAAVHGVAAAAGIGAWRPSIIDGATGHGIDHTLFCAVSPGSGSDRD